MAINLKERLSFAQTTRRKWSRTDAWAWSRIQSLIGWAFFKIQQSITTLLQFLITEEIRYLVWRTTD